MEVPGGAYDGNPVAGRRLRRTSVVVSLRDSGSLSSRTSVTSQSLKALASYYAAESSSLSHRIVHANPDHEIADSPPDQ